MHRRDHRGIQVSGKASRDKGDRNERLAATVLPGAVKVSRAYQAGIDLIWRHRKVEVKVRAAGFKLLYRWLSNAQLLLIRADRSDWLVVMRVSDLLSLMEDARNPGRGTQPER